jgi:hypothetical protein
MEAAAQPHTPVHSGEYVGSVELCDLCGMSISNLTIHLGLPESGMDLPPADVMREVFGKHADDPQVQRWVREFRVFMRQRETWYPEDDAGFWNRLGIYGDMTAHYPFSVDSDGNGPASGTDTHHYRCACGDVDCPLTVALQHAWLAGKRAKNVTYWFPGEKAPRDA